ncbi:centrosomal protein CCDC61-like [Coccinella septempunctata]|uniref:centrosomal protein CCDC61-like n=1 Tax=Coccinella septempunctata TaxID=41139 RepID=UPI001D05EC44|nr:centrosomal protein CCDC61-like [Coccinella septempunctata]
MVDPNLVTTCNFHGQEFLFKMNVLGNNLEILITDKNSGEEWQCSYDATYIENLTHKTGNFKQFDIFVTMIKSGLLRTSECVSLDLLTFEDLELLRSRKITKVCGQNNNNRRYLIVTYCVEFDRIRYPIPLEYCGPPDPVVLQATIKRLEAELERVKDGAFEKRTNIDTRKFYAMQRRIEELTDENLQLKEDINLLRKEIDKRPRHRVLCLEKAMEKLETSVANERNSHHILVEKLRKDKMDLVKELEKMKISEKILKQKLKSFRSPSRYCCGDGASPTRKKSDSSVNTVYRRKKQTGCQEPKISVEQNVKPKKSKSDSFWNTPANRKQTRCSRRDAFVKDANRSRSSSNSSVKYQSRGKYDNVQSLYVNERLQTPLVLMEKYNSRSSSAVSRCSSKDSVKKMRFPKYSDPDFKKLEDKIESLQKMLKRNFIK